MLGMEINRTVYPLLFGHRGIFKDNYCIQLVFRIYVLHYIIMISWYYWSCRVYKHSLNARNYRYLPILCLYLVIKIISVSTSVFLLVHWKSSERFFFFSFIMKCLLFKLKLRLPRFQKIVMITQHIII